MGVAALGGGALALFVMVGRWTPGRILGRSDWWALPPRVWAVIGIATAVAFCFLLPFNRGPWARSDRANIWRTVLFLGYMMAAAMWSRAGIYAGDKAFLLGLILLAAILTARLAHDTGAWMARSFWAWMALATTIYAAYTAQAGWFQRRRTGVERLVTPLGGGPNVFARLAGLLTIAGANYGTRGSLWTLWYVPAALAVVLILATGSRGGLLATIVGLLAMAEARGVFRRRGILPAVLVVGLIIGGISVTRYWDRAVAVFQARVVEMAFEKRDDAGRAILYRQAWRLGTAAPFFGSGLGGFHARNPIGDYPHNMFLEAFAEGGLVGVVLLTMVVVGGGRQLAPYRHTDLGTVTWAAFITLAVASQFSGDLYDARLLFVLPALRPSLPASETGELARY
jgi:O-antigen ligase